MGGRGGASGLIVSKSQNVLSGTEKQIKYAKDILKSVNDEIDRSLKERLEKGKNERFLARIEQTEKEFEKTVKQSAELLKKYYDKKAYVYYGGNAGDIIGNRFSFKINDIKSTMLSVENDIRAGGNQDRSGIKLEIEKIEKRGHRYKK